MKRLTIRFSETQTKLIKEVSEILDQNYSQVIRNSLRFGLQALLKFEGSDKKIKEMLKEIRNEKSPEQQSSEPSIQENYTECERKKIDEEIEIAQVKWFTETEEK